jgi:hypothetical protein
LGVADGAADAAATRLAGGNRMVIHRPKERLNSPSGWAI